MKGLRSATATPSCWRKSWRGEFELLVAPSPGRGTGNAALECLRKRDRVSHCMTASWQGKTRGFCNGEKLYFSLQQQHQLSRHDARFFGAPDALFAWLGSRERERLWVQVLDEFRRRRPGLLDKGGDPVARPRFNTFPPPIQSSGL